jgi:predicted ATPase
MEGARKQRDTLSGHHTETETCLSDSLRRLSPVTQTSWIAITGAPGSGKSTLIDALKAHGLTTVSEAARTYIEEQTQRGLSVADIRADGRQFLSAILDRSIAKAENTDPSKLIFFDRGIPDTIAYQR